MQGVWFDRSSEYRMRLKKEPFGKYQFARTLPVPHEPLPCWKALSVEERRRRVAELVIEIEDEAEARNRELRRRPMGAAKILRQDPHDHPGRIAKSPAPLVHASSRERFFEYRKQYSEFVLAFRTAALRLKAGVLAAIDEFPNECFLPRFPWRSVLAATPAAVAS